MWLRAGLVGAASGVAGVAVMTIGEVLEQRRTGRPDSFVPAHTLERLLRMPERPDHERVVLNHVMHWGTGAVVGVLRGVMAQAGLRGPRGSAMHSVVRLTTDQVLENATGVGAPPWTWPRSEQVIDVAHKVVYSLATGVVADALLRHPVPHRPPAAAAKVVPPAGPGA